MWILVFLLSVLVNIKDRRKILLIAGTFVVVSGLAYFAFMAAWLNVLHADWIGATGPNRAGHSGDPDRRRQRQGLFRVQARSNVIDSGICETGPLQTSSRNRFGEVHDGGIERRRRSRSRGQHGGIALHGRACRRCTRKC